MSIKGRLFRLRFIDFVLEIYRFDEKYDREVFMECYKGRIILYFFWCFRLSGCWEKDLNIEWLNLWNVEYKNEILLVEIRWF